MKLLYISMTRQEKKLGWIYLIVSLILLAPLTELIPVFHNHLINFLYHAVNFAAAVWIFRAFLTESIQLPFLKVSQLLWKAFLCLILTQLVNLLTNDLLFFYFPYYYFYDDTGPHFINASKAMLEIMLQDNFWLSGISAVFLVPAVEELFHRGLVFGSIHRKNNVLAYLLSTALYAFLHVVMLIGRYELAYIVVSFVQYIPIGLFMSWFYVNSDTILTPILAHTALNAVSVFCMR